MSIAKELRYEAERNGRLDAPCVHLLRKAADEIERIQQLLTVSQQQVTRLSKPIKEQNS